MGISGVFFRTCGCNSIINRSNRQDIFVNGSYGELIFINGSHGEFSLVNGSYSIVIFGYSLNSVMAAACSTPFTPP